MDKTNGLGSYDYVSLCDNKYSACWPAINDECDTTCMDGRPNHPRFSIKDVGITNTDCGICLEIFERQRELHWNHNDVEGKVVFISRHFYVN